MTPHLGGIRCASPVWWNGVRTRNLTESVSRAPRNALVTWHVFSYRSTRQVALDVVLENPD